MTNELSNQIEGMIEHYLDEFLDTYQCQNGVSTQKHLRLIFQMSSIKE